MPSAQRGRNSQLYCIQMGSGDFYAAWQDIWFFYWHLGAGILGAENESQQIKWVFRRANVPRWQMKVCPSLTYKRLPPIRVCMVFISFLIILAIWGGNDILMNDNSFFHPSGHSTNCFHHKDSHINPTNNEQRFILFRSCLIPGLH